MEIITIILAIYVFVSPFLMLRCVQMGARLATKPEQAAVDDVFNVPKPKKKPKMTEEDERRAKILANINRYDGSSSGQVPVKEK